MKLFDNDFKYFDNPLLKRLLRVLFDAVLTTNYTYELENALDDNYPRSDHKEDWACTTAANISTGKQPDSVRLLNTFNRLKNEDGKDVDIWHIHGEVRDPASMILTHEEYGRLVTELVREEQNENNEGEILFDSWQEYFVYGDLYILGQGVNFAEFDLWWMLSRRRREKTGMGRTFYYAPQQASKKYTDVEEALDQIGLKIDNCGVTLPEFGSIPHDEMNQIFRNFYDTAAARIQYKIEHPLPMDTEMLIEYRERTAKNRTKANCIRMMYQLMKTKVYTPGHFDEEGMLFTPWLYGYEGEDPVMLALFTTKDAYPDDPEDLYELSGLEALDIVEEIPGIKILDVDPFSPYGDVRLTVKQAQYMRRDPEELKKYVEEADERELKRRRNNALKASEATYYVQSYISNCSFDTSLDELWFDIQFEGYFNYEALYHEEEVQWTAPKWAKPGDIAFFIHTRTAKSIITRLRTELRAQKNTMPKEKYEILEREINRALQNYEKIGGKIFAIGQVCAPTEEASEDDPFYNDENRTHWKSRSYACGSNVFILKHPVSMDDFSDFIMLSRGGSYSIVLGENFTRLRDLILDKNQDQDDIPFYFRKSLASPLALANIGSENWMKLSEDFRRQLSGKTQYQSFYTHFLLEALGDTKKIWLQCRYHRPEMEHDAFMDNVISFGKRYLPVKILFSTSDMADADAIAEKYCNSTVIFLEKDKSVGINEICTDHVLVIDTEKVSVYHADSRTMAMICYLNDLKTPEDVEQIRQTLACQTEAGKDKTIYGDRFRS